MKNKYDISQEDIKDWLSAETPTPQDVDRTEEALLAFARAHAQPPPPQLRDQVLAKLSRLNQQRQQRQALDPTNLPLLDASANWLDWQALVADIEPPAYDDVHLHPLAADERRELFVIWVKEYVPEEVHHDVLESFLILEGSCQCHLTDQTGHTRIVHMGPGDFITMPLEETHDILITSAEPAKGILQWLKAA